MFRDSYSTDSDYSVTVFVRKSVRISSFQELRPERKTRLRIFCGCFVIRIVLIRNIPSPYLCANLSEYRLFRSYVPNEKPDYGSSVGVS